MIALPMVWEWCFWCLWFTKPAWFGAAVKVHSQESSEMWLLFFLPLFLFVVFLLPSLMLSISTCLHYLSQGWPVLCKASSIWGHTSPGPGEQGHSSSTFGHPLHDQAPSTGAHISGVWVTMCPASWRCMCPRSRVNMPKAVGRDIVAERFWCMVICFISQTQMLKIICRQLHAELKPCSQCTCGCSNITLSVP